MGGPAGSPAALTLLAGGTLTSGGAPTGTSGITLGGAAGTVGTVAVTGATLDANGTRLTIGDAGAGTLTVSDGGTARAGASYANSEAALALGETPGGTGMLTVSGPGSQLVANGAAVIGGTEAGSSVTVDQASTLAATSLTLQGGTADVYTLPAATAVSFGPGGSLVVHAVSGAASASGFTFGDSLDLAGVTGQSGLQSTVSVGSGTLSVNPAAGVTSYLSDDGNGGTLVTPTSTSVTIYRFFESDVGIEFLTTNAGEAATIQQTQPGYVYEGASSDLVRGGEQRPGTRGRAATWRR